jgi:RNA polymerase sigma factor (sigma-70 family)
MRIDENLLDPINFDEFISRLKNNDEYIWKTLYFVLKRVVYNWILKRGITDVKAKKIYQDTFSTFYEKINSCDFKNFNKLKSYVLAIAANKIKEAYRNEMREQRLVAIDSLNPKKLSPQFYFDNESHHEENKTVVRHMLNSLDDRERYIVYSIYYKNENVNDIANRLGISNDNCRVIKHRAIQKLKTLLMHKKIRRYGS